MVTVKVSNLSKTFVSSERIVRAVVDVSFELRSGEALAVVGESGSGKTTLLRILACQIAPDRGVVTIGEESLPSPHSSRGAEFRNKSVGFVFQEFGLVEQETARSNIALPLRYAGIRRRKALAIADGLMRQMRIPHLADVSVRNLSAGQRQRVAIARACATNPGLVLADEPTSNLDPENREAVMDSLLELRSAGKSVVIATHDELVWRRCDRIIRLVDGRLQK